MFWSFFRQRPARRASERKPSTMFLSVERLEDRTVPTTFTVLSLADNGAGPLRQAILNANAHVGADTIDFKVAPVPRRHGQPDPDLEATFGNEALLLELKERQVSVRQRENSRWWETITLAATLHRSLHERA